MLLWTCFSRQGLSTTNRVAINGLVGVESKVNNQLAEFSPKVCILTGVVLCLLAGVAAFSHTTCLITDAAGFPEKFPGEGPLHSVLLQAYAVPSSPHALCTHAAAS